MIVITVASSLVLSLAYTSLKSIQDINIIVDKQKNVLKSLGFNSELMTASEIQQKYLDTIEEIVVDLNGNVVRNISHEKWVYGTIHLVHISKTASYVQRCRMSCHLWRC